MNTAAYLTISSPKLCANFMSQYCLEFYIFQYSSVYYAEKKFVFVCSAEILENVIGLKWYLLQIMSYYWQDIIPVY